MVLVRADCRESERGIAAWEATVCTEASCCATRREASCAEIINRTEVASELNSSANRVYTAHKSCTSMFTSITISYKPYNLRLSFYRGHKYMYLSFNFHTHIGGPIIYVQIYFSFFRTRKYIFQKYIDFFYGIYFSTYMLPHWLAYFSGTCATKKSLPMTGQ
jgi:hypothetical protein